MSIKQTISRNGILGSSLRLSCLLSAHLQLQKPTMASLLPTIPRYFFCFIEPTLLILTFATTSIFPSYYVFTQSKHAPRHRLLPTEQILTFQLGNLFLLIAVIELYVFSSTTDTKAVRALITALWWGDLGHLGVTTWCGCCRTAQPTILELSELGKYCPPYASVYHEIALSCRIFLIGTHTQSVGSGHKHLLGSVVSERRHIV
jgi:hypothetical protein